MLEDKNGEKTFMPPRILQTYKKESIDDDYLKNRRETQTDWSWISDMKMLDKLKEGTCSSVALFDNL